MITKWIDDVMQQLSYSWECLWITVLNMDNDRIAAIEPVDSKRFVLLKLIERHTSQMPALHERRHKPKIPPGLRLLRAVGCNLKSQIMINDSIRNKNGMTL